MCKSNTGGNGVDSGNPYIEELGAELGRGCRRRAIENDVSGTVQMQLRPREAVDRERGHGRPIDRKRVEARGDVAEIRWVAGEIIDMGAVQIEAWQNFTEEVCPNDLQLSGEGNGSIAPSLLLRGSGLVVKISGPERAESGATRIRRSYREDQKIFGMMLASERLIKRYGAPGSSGVTPGPSGFARITPLYRP